MGGAGSTSRHRPTPTREHSSCGQLPAMPTWAGVWSARKGCKDRACSVPWAVLFISNVPTSKVVLLCLEVAFTVITVDFAKLHFWVRVIIHEREGSSGSYLQI